MTEAKQSKRSISNRLWGRMAGLEKRIRAVSLAFVLVGILAMSFCQLGFWSIGTVFGMSVYLLLLLAPLFMGAYLFGPITGALLGLYTGVVALFHAQIIPVDYYEIVFMTSINSLVLLTVLGALAGWLFKFTLRDNLRGAARVGAITLVSVALSSAASCLMQLNSFIMYGGAEAYEKLREVLLITPMGVALQVIIDAVIIAALCVFADYVWRALVERPAGERRLLTVFRAWMFAISLIVFMATSGVIFTVATMQAEAETTKSMTGEVSYLVKQLEKNDEEEAAKLLDGYDSETDGVVVIMDQWGRIVASDETSRFGTGTSFIKDIGYYYEGAGRDYAAEFMNSVIEEGGLAQLQKTDEHRKWTMDIEILCAASYSEGYVAMLRPSRMVYANRFHIMFAATLLAVVLIAAISLVASRLLNTVVVSRIDETNDSLEKITEGDLNECVGVRDSREFSSLSSGINTTVAALRGTIEEVEQKNAQELMTAKAIQESSLPTEFPAFPDIDRFDIYASMKTAKEVGGDFYDFFEIDDAKKIGFIMADVSGKGIPAALFMMTAKTQIKNHMEAGMPLSKAVDAANHQLCISNDAGMFVTAWIAELDYQTGALEYVNAGHNPPLILRDGSWEWVRDVSGMPLGLFDGIPYESFAMKLQPGDMIYTYTDGVTEAMNHEDELFGEDRLIQTLSKYTEFNPRSVCVGVRRALTDFTLDAEQSDDITMLGLKYGVPPEEKAVMILPAKTDQLVHVVNYIHAELGRRHAPKLVYNPLDIAAEELFVNVCHYAYPDATPEHPGEARISFDYEPSPPALTVQIIDDGVPYNPLAKPDAVTPDDIDAVPIGGLGILMAKKSVDSMEYERVGDSNVLTFKKGW